MQAALSLLHGTDLSSYHYLSLFFKGLYKLKPTTPKYTHTWDINIVLKGLEKWHPTSSLSLKKLTHKLTMLLALRTAYRVQHLSLIKSANIKVSSHGVEITITDITKNFKSRIGTASCCPTIF